jgi:DNA-binding Lrp family transcriptional regulator
MKVNIALFICCIIAIFYAYTKHMQAGEARPNDTLVVHDTAWQRYDSLIVRKVPKPYEVIVEITSKPEMLPDTNYARLKEQYTALLQLYINKFAYNDTIRVGSYGYIALLDTVKENKIVYRRTRDNFNIPIVKETKTITTYAPPTRNVFVGAGVLVNNALGIRGAEAGMILKTKKDQLYNIKASVDIDGNVMYGAGYYYKLK